MKIFGARVTLIVAPFVMGTTACVDFTGRFASGLVAKAGEVGRMLCSESVGDPQVCMSCSMRNSRVGRANQD
jgi:hypothetical protein